MPRPLALALLALACLALVACADDIRYARPDLSGGGTTPGGGGGGGTTTPGGGANRCDPADDASCVCLDLDTGATCAPGAARCRCDRVDNNTPLNNAGRPPGWRFVLIEDTLGRTSGEYPGTDVDAVELIDARDNIFFATTVEDFQLGGGQALDPSQALGPPDARCDAGSGRFVSLGGQAAGGYLIVGFSTSAQDVTFGAGSRITVYELGASLCGQFDDDPYAVAISVSSDKSAFTQIGAASGAVPIPVTVNP